MAENLLLKEANKHVIELKDRLRKTELCHDVAMLRIIGEQTWFDFICEICEGKTSDKIIEELKCKRDSIIDRFDKIINYYG